MDDDEGPDLRIGQQRGELLGELVLIVCLGWADAEDLFELIEDEERVFPVWAGVDELRKCGFVTVLFPVVADAPDVAVLEVISAGGSELTRVGSQTSKWSSSSGMRPALMRELLPAPEGEWSRTRRSEMRRWRSSVISRLRPKMGLVLAKGRGPTKGFDIG